MEEIITFVLKNNPDVSDPELRDAVLRSLDYDASRFSEEEYRRLIAKLRPSTLEVHVKDDVRHTERIG